MLKSFFQTDLINDKNKIIMNKPVYLDLQYLIWVKM